jgi:hypothetical protein
MQYYTAQWEYLEEKLNFHSPEYTEPRKLLTWLHTRRARTGSDTITAREICNRGPNSLRKGALARAALEDLADRGYVRPKGKCYELRPENL